MRVVYCAYREWALKIIWRMETHKHSFLLVSSHDELDYEKCKDFEPDLFLFYGWSWMVGKEFLDLAPCVCLHPSPLPRYRGGSPIQNQIIRGEKKSAVSLFYMTDKVDAGDVILQEEISFEGHLQDILDRMTETGIKLTRKMLDGKTNAVPQRKSEVTCFPRRKPCQSELKAEDFNNKNAQELYDFIRALEDPYPNAFIVCKDGKRLLFKCCEIE